MPTTLNWQQTRLVRCDARKLPANAGQQCDVVFLDPPYGKGLGQVALNTAQAQSWIAPQALIVWEENARQIAPEGFPVLDNRRYGDPHITIMQGNGPVLA